VRLDFRHTANRGTTLTASPADRSGASNRDPLLRAVLGDGALARVAMHEGDVGVAD